MISLIMKNIHIISAFIRSRMLNNTDHTLYATGFKLCNRIISANFLSFDLFFVETGRLKVQLMLRCTASNENLHELYVLVNRNVAKSWICMSHHIR